MLQLYDWTSHNLYIENYMVTKGFTRVIEKNIIRFTRNKPGSTLSSNRDNLHFLDKCLRSSRAVYMYQRPSPG